MGNTYGVTRIIPNIELVYAKVDVKPIAKQGMLLEMLNFISDDSDLLSNCRIKIDWSERYVVHCDAVNIRLEAEIVEA